MICSSVHLDNSKEASGGHARLDTNALFVWVISHQPAVLFSQNKSATSNQPAVLFSQNKSAPATSQTNRLQIAWRDWAGHIDTTSFFYDTVYVSHANACGATQILVAPRHLV
jgi:hypothetical protein